jgi:hypothetical protein
MGSSVVGTCPVTGEAEDKISVEAATKKGRRTEEKTERNIASECSFISYKTEVLLWPVILVRSDGVRDLG